MLLFGFILAQNTEFGDKYVSDFASLSVVEELGDQGGMGADPHVLT